MTVHSVAPEDCCGCSACFNICPVQAITMQEDREGFKYPKIDERAALTAANVKKPARFCMQKRQGGRCIRRFMPCGTGRMRLV